MKFDFLIKNGKCVTMDKQLRQCSWIGIADGKIAELGEGECHAQADHILDAQGYTILPGLTDCHVHVLNTGIALNGVDLQHCNHMKGVLAALEDRCQREEGDCWIYGVNYVVQNIEEARYPTKWELDQICNGHKVVVFAATLHGCGVNSEGEKIADVPCDYPGVEKEGAECTGVYLSDESSFLATANILGSLGDDQLWKFIADCTKNAASKGVTTIHGLFGQFVKEDRDLDLILERGAQLDIDVVPFYQTWDVKKAFGKGLPRVGGCLTLDGALFEYTMANFEPYITEPALRGVLYHTDEEVYRVVSDAHEREMQCSMHAVGERAIDQLIYTYYRVIKEQGPKDLRHRIEHFCLPTEGQIKMAAELGLILSMQPGFTYLWDRETGGEFAMILGRERANRWDPFHRILSAGNVICGGSDSPVTAVEPLIDIATCVNGNNPVRNISVTDAIKMYTVNAAYAVGQEEEKGSIEVGKLADLVIIDRNPYICAATQDIYGMQVKYTIKNGQIIYEA